MTLTEFHWQIHHMGYKLLGSIATGDDWSVSYIDPSTPDEIRSIYSENGIHRFSGGEFDPTVKSLKQQLGMV